MDGPGVDPTVVLEGETQGARAEVLCGALDAELLVLLQGTPALLITHLLPHG